YTPRRKTPTESMTRESRGAQENLPTITRMSETAAAIEPHFLYPKTRSAMMNEITEWAIAHNMHTANLIAIYNTPNLVQYLNDAEAIELEKTILKRAGLKDA